MNLNGQPSPNGQPRQPRPWDAYAAGAAVVIVLPTGEQLVALNADNEWRRLEKDEARVLTGSQHLRDLVKLACLPTVTRRAKESPE